METLSFQHWTSDIELQMHLVSTTYTSSRMMEAVRWPAFSKRLLSTPKWKQLKLFMSVSFVKQKGYFTVKSFSSNGHSVKKCSAKCKLLKVEITGEQCTTEELNLITASNLSETRTHLSHLNFLNYLNGRLNQFRESILPFWVIPPVRMLRSFRIARRMVRRIARSAPLPL